jgi:hypothetical protein
MYPALEAVRALRRVLLSPEMSLFRHCICQLRLVGILEQAEISSLRGLPVCLYTWLAS